MKYIWKAVWNNVDEIMILVIGGLCTVMFVNVAMMILEKLLMGGYK